MGRGRISSPDSQGMTVGTAAIGARCSRVGRFTAGRAVSYTMECLSNRIHSLGGAKWLKADAPSGRRGNRRRRLPARSTFLQLWYLPPRLKSSRRSGRRRTTTSSIVHRVRRLGLGQLDRPDMSRVWEFSPPRGSQTRKCSHLLEDLPSLDSARSPEMADHTNYPSVRGVLA